MEHHIPRILNRHNTAQSTIDVLHRNGTIRRILPGVYTPTALEEDFLLRAEATAAWCPGARFVGSTAARLSWWPEHPDEQVRISHRVQGQPAPWLLGDQRALPTELFRPFGQSETTTAWMSTPSFSILDMMADGDGNAICEGLRRGVTTLARLHETLALLPRSRGNKLRRQLLRDSRDTPWSPLERDAHVMLRKAGITGWVTNHEVVIAGERYFLDIALPIRKVAIEIDGWKYHSSRQAFELDRTRQNSLVEAGWRIFRFTDHSLDHLVPTLQRLPGVR